MTMPLLLPSLRRQQRVLDFAYLQHNSPEGIYVTLSPENPAIWSGVLFARGGPYESATLRFGIAFPPTYPETAPTITFSTDVFHPLVVPLTQYTFSASALDSAGTVSASDEDRVPPGSFSLRHGFPQWSMRSRNKSTRSSLESASDLNPSPNEEIGVEAAQDENLDPLDTRATTLRILEHLKRAFEDQEYLDSLPFSVVGNPSAWHAWRAHRGLAQNQARGRSPDREAETPKPPASPKQMSDWNWDGVWESRVQDSVNASISEGGLYTNQGLVRFSKMDKAQLAEIRQQLRAS